MQLTQRENQIIKELKTQEKLCAEKYMRSASIAHDRQLKNLFYDLASIEQKHYRILRELELGIAPKLNASFGKERSYYFSNTYGKTDDATKRNDSYLCNDVLALEKHSSNIYDTCIFEFSEKKARNILGYIQKEEQDHGKHIYDYMSANYM